MTLCAVCGGPAGGLGFKPQPRHPIVETEMPHPKGLFPACSLRCQTMICQAHEKGFDLVGYREEGTLAKMEAREAMKNWLRENLSKEEAARRFGGFPVESLDAMADAAVKGFSAEIARQIENKLAKKYNVG